MTQFKEIVDTVSEDAYVSLVDDATFDTVYEGQLKNVWIAVRLSKLQQLEVTAASNHNYEDSDGMIKDIKLFIIRDLAKNKIRRAA